MKSADVPARPRIPNLTFRGGRMECGPWVPWLGTSGGGRCGVRRQGRSHYGTSAHPARLQHLDDAHRRFQMPSTVESAVRLSRSLEGCARGVGHGRMILGARPRRVDVMQIDDICELLPTPKTTLYYDPDGRCESAYVQLRTGRPVKKVEPDPRYLVSVYFGVGEVPIGIRM